MSNNLPTYEQLPVIESAPAGSSWGLWGPSDVFGCLNLLAADDVRQAASLVRTGRSFSLNWMMELPDPPLFDRASLQHRVLVDGAWQDDQLTDWNTQSSSQWDGFRHVRSEKHGYYGGVPNEEHGIHHWARKGIVGRGVLVDVGRYREEIGRPLQMFEADPISAQELEGAIAHFGLHITQGTILLVRTGWIEWYVTLNNNERRQLAEDLRTPGLQPGKELLTLLWNLHISALASDNPAVELFGRPLGDHHDSTSHIYDVSRDESDDFAHLALLPLLGLPLGELFDLGALAEDCLADGVYEGMFCSAPLNLRGGVASPPNALFIK